MTVLVAYDGSAPAQTAIEHAIDRYPDDEIVLLRVIEMSGGHLMAGWDLLQERLKDAQDEGAAELSEAVRDLIDDADVEFRIETAVGKPAQEIVEFAEDEGVDVIVVGSHGREGVSRVLLGNVAERIVRRAPMTVTVVR
ncbi:universal stress protein [Salinarchaeum laminariae]|uniref:universal stress protein n=1 Tax=Salinarchaeum laminariae TaxID=869888 RepID=UPI0020C12635|nr:universal stress protein [Salinarchaeum laminariae]